jgi:Arc/MetJ-type ribon-helix-helix transcriptional regulator
VVTNKKGNTKMKHQASITIDEETMKKVKEKLRQKTFRNQSHLFEFAVEKLLEEEND